MKAWEKRRHNQKCALKGMENGRKDGTWKKITDSHQKQKLKRRNQSNWSVLSEKWQVDTLPLTRRSFLMNVNSPISLFLLFCCLTHPLAPIKSYTTKLSANIRPQIFSLQHPEPDIGQLLLKNITLWVNTSCMSHTQRERETALMKWNFIVRKQTQKIEDWKYRYFF